MQQFAANLLEDIRIERRIVEDFGQRARPWLRANLEAVYPDEDTVVAAAEMHGWAKVLSALAGRAVAGVLSDDQFNELAHLGDPHGIIELREIWRAYASLGDDAINDDGARRLVKQMAARLP